MIPFRNVPDSCPHSGRSKRVTLLHSQPAASRDDSVSLNSLPPCLVFTPSCTAPWARSHSLSKGLNYQVGWTWQNRPSLLTERRDSHTSLRRELLKRKMSRGWSADLCVGQATLPLRLLKHHFPSPLETLYLQDHIIARAFFLTWSCCCPRDISYHLNPAYSSSAISRHAGYSGNSPPGLRPCTTHSHISSHFHCSSPNVATLPVQFSDFFHADIVLWYELEEVHKYLPIFNGNSLMSFWNKSGLGLKELATFL